MFLIIYNGTFLRLNLIKITHQNASIILKFSRGACPEPPSISVADIKVVIFYSEFLQNINQNGLDVETASCSHCSKFSKISPEAIRTP